jgi:hypothetical protein
MSQIELWRIAQKVIKSKNCTEHYQHALILQDEKIILAERQKKKYLERIEDHQDDLQRNRNRLIKLYDDIDKSSLDESIAKSIQEALK